MKKIFIVILLASQFVISQNAAVSQLVAPMVAAGDNLNANRKLNSMRDNPQKYKDSIPYYWSENMEKSSVMTTGPLTVIDDKIINLSQQAEVAAWVDHAARVKYDNFIKTLPPTLQIWATEQVKSGNGGFGFFAGKDAPMIQVDHFNTPEQIKNVGKILATESENMTKWNQIESSLVSGNLAKEIELDVKLKNGQSMSLFGTANEIQQQLKQYNLDGFSSDKIESTTLKRVNRFKLEALYEAFNNKNGKVFNFALNATPADYGKFRKFVQTHNFEQKPSIKVPLTAKIGSAFKGTSKSVGIAAIFGVAAGAAMANESSEAAEKQFNGPSSTSAPRIQRAGTSQ